jgi:Mu transposase, C-terminal domain
MYREVTMLEVKEVLRLWREGVPTKRLAAQLGLDPKTVRRYLRAAAAAGLRADGSAVSDEEVREVLLALQPVGGRPRGDGWARCETQREAIRRWLTDGLRLTKIRKLLLRQGVGIAYPTLYRFAVLELQFGQTATTIPVLDGPPGQELQVDTGWVGWLTLPSAAKRRRFRAWIFTAVRSRHRFVYPTFEETTARAIEACEAAWAFFGGTFTVLIPDNTKAIITQADPLAPRITPAFLEYAQARHFHIDAARVRHARDKGRVERAVPTVRDDCFAGEVLTTLDDARTHAVHWCLDDYGLRRHSRTQRRPLEHFRAEEQPVLRPAPATPYDIPRWSEPKVARDQLATVDKATYSIPHRYVGQILVARADAQIVRFYLRGLLIKTHPRQPPGRQSIDATDYPVERSIYAFRNVDALRQQAEQVGETIGRYASALLDSPLPWTRMRRVYALLGLVRRYGPARVTAACTVALAADMLDVRRVQRMLEHGAVPPPDAPIARTLPRARYLRPATQYALPLTAATPSSKGETPE